MGSLNGMVAAAQLGASGAPGRATARAIVQVSCVALPEPLVAVA